MKGHELFLDFRRLGGALWLGLCLLVWLSSPASAARKDFDVFSVDLPAGWTAAEEEKLISLSAPKGQCTISVLSLHYLKGVEDGLAWTLARNNSIVRMHALGEGLGLAFGQTKEKHWARLGGNRFVHIMVENSCPELKKVLQSFRPSKDADDPDMPKVLALLQQPQVLAWLVDGDIPAKAADVPAPAPVALSKPDFAALGGPAEKDAPRAEPGDEEMPEGWSKSQEGAWTVLTSPDGKSWQALRHYRHTEAEDMYVKLAEKLGGFNINMSEGALYFDTPQGYIGYMAPFDENFLTLTLQTPDQEGEE